MQQPAQRRDMAPVTAVKVWHLLLQLLQTLRFFLLLSDRRLAFSSQGLVLSLAFFCLSAFRFSRQICTGLMAVTPQGSLSDLLASVVVLLEAVARAAAAYHQ